MALMLSGHSHTVQRLSACQNTKLRWDTPGKDLAWLINLQVVAKITVKCICAHSVQYNLSAMDLGRSTAYGAKVRSNATDRGTTHSQVTSKQVSSNLGVRGATDKRHAVVTANMHRLV